MNLQPENTIVAEKRPIHLPSALQLGFALAGIALLLSGASGMAALGFFSAMAGGAEVDPLMMLLTAASLLGIAILLTPSVYYSLMRILGRPAFNSARVLGGLHPGAWLMFFPLLLLVGYFASQSPVLSWIVLPLLHVPAIGLPIAWMVALAIRALPLGSSQRLWGVFNTGLALGPFIISIFEIIAVIGLIVVAIASISGNPELIAKLTAIAEMTRSGQATEAELLEAVGPYMLSPGVVLGVLALGALIVPLIEEALKPIGVWLLMGRPLSASAGFAAGALSGAGFALTESLLLSSNGGDWATLVLVRAGTGAIHIVTAALTGWALALARKRRSYLRLLLTYFTVVVIHGLWNGMTILTVFASLAQMQNRPEALPLISRLAPAAPFALIVLAGGALFLLIFFNRRLRRTDRLPPSDRPAPLTNTPAAGL